MRAERPNERGARRVRLLLQVVASARSVGANTSGQGSAVQKYMLIGLVALVAGVLVGGFTLLYHPPSSTSAAAAPTRMSSQSQIEAQAFLATPPAETSVG